MSPTRCFWCQDPFRLGDLIVPAEVGLHGAMHAECWCCWSRVFYPDLARREAAEAELS